MCITNEAILEVLGYFSKWSGEQDKKLYVLAADFDMDELEDYIRGIYKSNKSKCEIMITNYEIKSFYDIGWDDFAKNKKKVKINSDFINNKAFKVLEYAYFYRKAKAGCLISVLNANFFLQRRSMYAIAQI